MISLRLSSTPSSLALRVFNPKITTSLTAMGGCRVVAAAPPAQWQLLRWKTFVKQPTRGRRKYLKRMEELKQQGLPRPPKPQGPVMENRFWKVVGDMKVYKNVSNGCRHRRHPTFHHLHKGPAIHRLSFGKRSTGGRASNGRISVRHRGGGHKRRVRILDLHRTTPGAQEVVRLEYDPNRTADLALLRSLSTNQFSYIIRPAGVNPGDVLYSWRSGIPTPQVGEDPIPKHKMISPGNCLMLKDIPVGTTIHAIGLRPSGPAQLCRSAGTSADLLSTGPSGYAQIRLGSKEIRLVPVQACATIGKVGTENHQQRVWGKAGASRRRGIRPSVRGIAMSAYDHPHGGGQKSKGGKAPRSPWGKKTKGWKTVRSKKSPLIVVSRSKAKAKSKK